MRNYYPYLPMKSEISVEISSGNGFAVMNVNTEDLLFSGSFKKCVEFVSKNKAVAFSEGLAIVSAECARNVIDANSIVL